MGNFSPTDAFPSTYWSRLRADQTAGAAQAWEELAARYWAPMVTWFQRERPTADPQDLAQGFFAWMMETDFASKAQPGKGPFRGFLKTALRHYLLSEDRKRFALRRGQGVAPQSLEAAGESAHKLRKLSTSERMTPDQALDAAWRDTVLSAAMKQVGETLDQRGRSEDFKVFEAYFLSEETKETYSTLAERYGRTPSDISNALMLAKSLYRESIKRLVSETVRGPLELKEELRWLLSTP